MKKFCTYASTGGGIRIGAAIGAEMCGYDSGKFRPERYDAFVGCSVGALNAVLTACGLTPKEKYTKFLMWDIPRILSPLVPWSIRLAGSALIPISLEPFAKEIDLLKLPIKDNVFISSWDSTNNKQVIFCEKIPDWADTSKDKSVWVENAFSRFGYGRCIIRSMALPILISDELCWMDGSYYENPPMVFLPKDSHVLLMDLGYPNLRPGSKYTVLRRFIYSSAVTQKSVTNKQIQLFDDIFVVEPGCYDISIVDFGLSVKQKKNFVQRAKQNSEKIWSQYSPPWSRV